MKTVIPFALFVIVVTAGYPESPEAIVDTDKPTTSDRQTETGSQQTATAHEHMVTRKKQTPTHRQQKKKRPLPKSSSCEVSCELARTIAWSTSC